MSDIRAFFDENASRRDALIKKNSYYYELLIDYLRFHIPEGKSVLEIGCGTGYVLNALKPSRGVGIDFSARMVAQARKRHPKLTFSVADAHTFSSSEKFDYILLSDTVGYFEDIQRVFKNIRKNCRDDTRIIINSYSFLWEPTLNLAARLKLKTREPYTSWLSVQDIVNLLALEGFEVVKANRKVLFPKYIPLFSWLCNKYAANLPLLRSLDLVNLLVARPVGLVPREERSVTVVVPARNERGNIEQILRRLPRFGSRQEVIFIEGGSNDGTYEEIVRVAKLRWPFSVRYAKQPGKGKGDAVRLGFDMARCDVLMILDADMTVPPEDLVKFYEAIASNKGEFINGSRLVYPMDDKAMRALNLLGNKFFSMMFSWLLDQRFKDTLCGTKVLSKRNYEVLKRNRSYFGDFDPFGDFDLIFGASKMDLKIVEMPIRYKERVYGDTNIRRFYHGLLLLRMCAFASRKIKFV